MLFFRLQNQTKIYLFNLTTYFSSFIIIFLVAGSSVNPASDTYAGLGPFSEPETLSLSRYIRSMGDKIELYLSIHSFSQLLLIPFGNSTAPYGNYHDAVSNKKYNTVY